MLDTAFYIYHSYLSGNMAVLNIIKLFLQRLRKEFQRNRCFERASGLSFTSLLALVPLSALIFSLLSSFGSFEGILKNFQSVLVKQFLPASQEVIMEYVTRFIDNTQALGVVGLFVFLITSVFLFNTIQNNFNDIWGSKPRVLSLRRLATYVSVLIAGSFLVSIGLSLTEMFRSLILFSRLKGIGESFSFLLEIVPLIILFFAFLLMIVLLPRDRVSLKSGLIGAVSGTVMWEIARKIFFFWTRYVIKMSVIYGSLAAVPILLLWLYVAWAIVLLSLEIAYVHQHWNSSWFIKTPEEMNPAERLLLGLELYFHIARRFLDGGRPVTQPELAEVMNLTSADINFFVENFYREQLVLFTGKNDTGLVPARSLDKITVQSVLECLLGKRSETLKTGKEAERIFNKIADSIRNSVGNVSVMEYLNSGDNAFGGRSARILRNVSMRQNAGKPGVTVSRGWESFKSLIRRIWDKE